jgi:branched-subunit amino acid ABC-type transport system permease component
LAPRAGMTACGSGGEPSLLRPAWPEGSRAEKYPLDLAAVVAIDFIYAIATLALISVGLAIVFGMMRIINLAHGEFMVMGSYSASVAVHHHVNIWIAILVVPPLAVAIIGAIIERLIIRYLYGRMVETMLATWGLSLFIVGALTMAFGDMTEGVPTPLPGIAIGAYQTSGYSLFVIVMSMATLLGVYVILRSSRLGLLARGTMQNAEMAAALGTDTSRIYAVTFAFGAALAGLAGGILAPVSGVFPSIGGSYIGRAFITVIGGGAAPLIGTVSASTLFGIINQIATFATNPVYGEVALLLAAIILIRLMPQGITGRFFRGSL